MVAPLLPAEACHSIIIFRLYAGDSSADVEEVIAKDRRHLPIGSRGHCNRSGQRGVLLVQRRQWLHDRGTCQSGWRFTVQIGGIMALE